MGNSQEIIHFEICAWSRSWTWKALWTRDQDSFFKSTSEPFHYVRFSHRAGKGVKKILTLSVNKQNM